MKYRLFIKRTIETLGCIEIEAESKKDAERKYWEPDFDKGEHLIFDDEIEWDVEQSDYEITNIQELRQYVCYREET